MKSEAEMLEQLFDLNLNLPRSNLFGYCKKCGKPRSENDFRSNMELLNDDRNLCEKCLLEEGS